MECVINDKVPYLAINAMIEEQQSLLQSHIGSLVESHVVHQGITHATDDQGKKIPVEPSEIPGHYTCFPYYSLVTVECGSLLGAHY